MNSPETGRVAGLALNCRGPIWVLLFLSNVLPSWHVLAQSNPPRRAIVTALPAELAELDEQFRKLEADRVTAVFDAEVGKLKASYRGSLDRLMAKETAAGELERALVIQAEHKRLDANEPIPSIDDAAVSAAMKDLRKVYRESLVKLERQRDANLKVLLDPLAVRLKQVETDLTKADRIADALAVRDYRNTVVARSAAIAALAAPDVAPAGETKAETPASKPMTPSSSASIPKEGIVNTLGMTFVPVPGTNVMMCLHETRKRDYAAFATEVSVPGVWKTVTENGVPVSDADDHPVVMVSWTEAQAFCAWLSQKEGRKYRLPTDREWSCAVGIGKSEPEGALPESLARRPEDREFPWGEKGPLPRKVGNFADETMKKQFPEARVLRAYDDGFVTTAPVMSFKRTRFGFYDLEGNVAEWVEDWFNVEKTRKVQRGGSWQSSLIGSLHSAYRYHNGKGTKAPYVGFRCVLEKP